MDNREWITIWAGENNSEILPQIINSIQPYDLLHKEFVLTASNVFAGEGRKNISITMGSPNRLSRHRPDWVKIILNGRVISFPELEQTILTSLERTLPRNRFPLCIVRLDLPCDRIDWNRHPAKTEAYIQNLNEIQSQLKDCITEVLKIPDSSSKSIYTSATNDLLRAAERKTS